MNIPRWLQKNILNLQPLQNSSNIFWCQVLEYQLFCGVFIHICWNELINKWLEKLKKKKKDLKEGGKKNPGGCGKSGGQDNLNTSSFWVSGWWGWLSPPQSGRLFCIGKSFYTLAPSNSRQEGSWAQMDMAVWDFWAWFLAVFSVWLCNPGLCPGQTTLVVICPIMDSPFLGDKIRGTQNWVVNIWKWPRNVWWDKELKRLRCLVFKSGSLLCLTSKARGWQVSRGYISTGYIKNSTKWGRNTRSQCRLCSGETYLDSFSYFMAQRRRALQ